CGPCYMNCYTTTTYTYSYPVMYTPYIVSQQSTVFPGATQAQRCIGPCVNAQCPDGYACNMNNVCCSN
ncbi:hypothetical protein TELCIR_20744, partial [Teladorsagia circumcincta]